MTHCPLFFIVDLYRDVMYAYPVEFVVKFPWADIKYGKLDGFQLDGIDTVAGIDKFDRFYSDSLICTDGFTKSQFGYKVIDVKKLYNEKYPDNLIYNTTRWRKMGAEDEVYSNKLFWCNIGNYSLLKETNTYEQKKRRHDTHNTKGELFWRELGINVDSKENEEENEDGGGIADDQEAKRIKEENAQQLKINKLAKKKADRHLLNIAHGETQWWREFLNLSMTDKFPPTYTAVDQLVKEYRNHIYMTNFDKQYLAVSNSAHYNQHIFPPKDQPGANKIDKMDWKWLYTSGDLSDVSSSTSNHDLARIMANLKIQVILLGFFYLGKYLTLDKDDKIYTEFDTVWWPLINEFVRIYNKLVHVNNLFKAVVEKILKKQPWLAYVLQYVKWMLYYSQKYCNILQDDVTHILLKQQWQNMTMNERYDVLAEIYMNKLEDNPVVEYLGTTGLRLLFEETFKDEQQNWIKLVGKALRYRQLWSLPPDWKPEKAAPAKAPPATTVPSITGNKRNESGEPMDEPPKKRRRKIVGKTKVDQQQEVIAQVTSKILLNWDEYVVDQSMEGTATGMDNDAVLFDFDKLFANVNTDDWEKQVPEEVIKSQQRIWQTFAEKEEQDQK